jgi:hypothetical protein
LRIVFVLQLTTPSSFAQEIIIKSLTAPSIKAVATISSSKITRQFLSYPIHIIHHEYDRPLREQFHSQAQRVKNIYKDEERKAGSALKEVSIYPLVKKFPTLCPAHKDVGKFMVRP